MNSRKLLQAACKCLANCRVKRSLICKRLTESKELVSLCMSQVGPNGSNYID
jgi:hypothetical protein